MSKRILEVETDSTPNLLNDIVSIPEVATPIFQHVTLYDLCTFRQVCRLFNDDTWILALYDFYRHTTTFPKSYWVNIRDWPGDIITPLNHAWAEKCQYDPLVINQQFNRYAFQLCQLIELCRALRQLIRFTVTRERISRGENAEEDAAYDELYEKTDDIDVYLRHIREREHFYNTSQHQHRWNTSYNDNVDLGLQFEIVFDTKDGTVDMLLTYRGESDIRNEPYSRMPLMKGKRYCLIRSLDLSYMCHKNGYDICSPIIKKKFKKDYCKYSVLEGDIKEQVDRVRIEQDILVDNLRKTTK